MSKAILVLDEVKECEDCDLFYIGDFGRSCPLVDIKNDKKPSYCPLKEAPEKLTSASDKLNELRNANVDPNSGWYGWPLDLAYESGWNECLNVIGTED